MKRAVVFLLVLCYLINDCLFAFAVVAPVDGSGLVDIEISVGNYWEALRGQAWHHRHWFVSLLDADVCPGRYEANGRHEFEEMDTVVNGVRGHYWICKYCGMSDGAVLEEIAQSNGKTVEEVFEEAYLKKVAALPYKSIDSAGGLYWSPEIAMVWLCGQSSAESAIRYVYRNAVWGDKSYVKSYNNVLDPEGSLCYFDMGTLSGSVYPVSGKAYMQYTYYKYLHTVQHGTVPITGYYSLMAGDIARYTWSHGTAIASGAQKGQLTNISSDSATVSCRSETGVFYTAGSTFTRYYNITALPVSNDSAVTPKVAQIDYTIFAPKYKIEPVETYEPDDDFYTPEIRSPSGLYGVDDSNGGVKQVTNNYTNIVNEGDNSIYNPISNTYYTYNDYYYDYVDRSYTCTTDGGVVSVTFGDDAVIIDDGNQQYKIYYMVERAVESCSHVWYETTTTDPTCLTAGTKTFMCSECGKVRTASVPQLWHDWVVRSSVLTQYDDDGNLIQQGHIIYVCTRCGDEYRVEGGVDVPPNGKSGSGGGGAGSLVIPVVAGDTIDDTLDAVDLGGDISDLHSGVSAIWDIIDFLRILWAETVPGAIFEWLAYMRGDYVELVQLE